MPTPDAGALPAALTAVDPGRIVDLDVRDDLRHGREPFSRIMAARESLEPDEVLRLRAIFEPAPLYGVLARSGFEHWTEQLGDEDWRVWFYRTPEAEANAPQPSGEGEDSPRHAEDAGLVILDVRGLEPPEPMVRTMQALERLPAGGTLLQINVRVPRFLLPQLDERGFGYVVREIDPDTVHVTIRRREAGSGGGPGEPATG